ncbi:MAG: cupin domain-containing protein [Verrucomicrobia bacterium]|nr:cupin domain-containing protein [Verrucomicrobiota bacterium]
MSPHHLQFSQLKPQRQAEGGYRIKASKSNFPALQNMSLYKLVLHQQAIREPHWHANADELGYCLKGQVLIAFYANGNVHEIFLISKGETFFIPSGTLHSVENIGEETAELLTQFSHEEPEDFGLSSTFGMFSNAVLGNTWEVPSQHFDSLKRPITETFIAKLKKSTVLPKEAYYPSKYQYSLESASPYVGNQGGQAKVARQSVWPILQKQALYSLILHETGMREPHWHPETAELGYVMAGKGRMSILSPSNKVDTYEMNEGDIYFIPKAYPHHIENLKNSDLHILIFFDQPMPEDIGFTASVKSYSDEILSSILHTPKEVFESLPTYYQDLLIVHKKNPLDK